MIFTVAFLAYSFLAINGQNVFKCRYDTINIDTIFGINNLYHSCHMDTLLELDTCAKYYSNMMQYIPDLDTAKPLHVPPIKTLKVNINIIQKDDGSGNIQNDSVDLKRIRKIVNNINDFYSSKAPSDPINWVTELPNYDSRIRFSIGEFGDERIFFYRNSSWWEPSNAHRNVDSIKEYLRINYPERLEEINIFVFGNHDFTNNYASASPPSYYNYDFSQYIIAYNWIPDADWGISKLLAHELAHLMGLLHTYLGGGASAICDMNNPEFLKDVFLVLPPDSINCPHICDYSANAYEFNGDGITNNILGGNKSECYISPMQAGQMHRALSLSSARKYVTSGKSEVPLVINNNQIWDFDMKLYQDLIVESEAQLTLTCHLVMNPDTKIIIKPGGRLIIDGAVIGTDIFEKEMWQGIEVWGNSSAHQYPVNGGYLQGYLEMKNGATIENAVCAVELCRPNYGNTSGGIIHASNAVFRNNTKSVHACYYSNYTPTNGAEVSYNSWFRNCTFTIDENYLGTETFYKHVDMEHVKGISFKGCDFSVLPNIDGVSSSCMGIGAYEAGFAVESYCDDIYNDPCPENSIIRSTFTGFNNGILSVNDGSNACAFSVKDAVFTNNNRGIYAQNTGFATILRNEFNIKSSGSICGYGVYAEGVTGFCIEENIFVPATNTRSHKYGVGIFNSRSVNDIYLNSFEGLTCGNLAYGINHTADLSGRPPAIVFGLTYSCNDNTDNAIDFCVLKDIGSEGIGSMQGSASSPAGNTFGGNQYHFYNDGSYPVNYYYNANSSYEIPNTSKLFGVNTYSTTYNNSCASHYGGGSVSKSPEEKAALADAYKLADDAYNQLVEMYDSQIAAGITPKTELIAQIYQYAHERNMAAGDIVRSDLNDSVANSTELRQWLGKMHDIAADRMAVASYMHEGDFKNALVLANSFPDIYSLKDDDLSDHNDYMKLLALYQTLYNSNRTVHEMTKEELVIVNGIAKDGLGTSRLMARAIMMEASDRFVEPYICPELPGWNSRGENSNTDYCGEENDGFKVSVTPIPTTTFVSVEYKLPDNTTKATMAITNVLGVKKIEAEVKGNQGVETIDISNLTPGIYILKVKTTDGKEYTERIVKE